MGSKRQASTPPFAPSEGAKLAKKKKGEASAENQASEEGPSSSRRQKREKSLVSRKDRRRSVEGRKCPTYTQKSKKAGTQVTPLRSDRSEAG